MKTMLRKTMNKSYKTMNKSYKIMINILVKQLIILLKKEPLILETILARIKLIGFVNNKIND